MLLRSVGLCEPATGFRGLRTAAGSPNTGPRGGGPDGRNDARTGMPARVLAGAMCVQRFDGSLNSAIHITYRISLRSSSMPEPRDPLLKVLIYLKFHSEYVLMQKIQLSFGSSGGPRAPRG